MTTSIRSGAADVSDPAPAAAIGSRVASGAVAASASRDAASPVLDPRRAMVGVAATSRFVYSACGFRSTRLASPRSSTRPPLITTIRSQSDAARLRSCVMNSMPMPRRSRCSASTAMISACVVTSRAVVGSSQTSSRGEPMRAPAIITRWSMPPESSCGCCRRCSSGRGIRTAPSRSTARARASAAGRPSPSRSASVRWSPIVRIGLMPARGSWKTIAALRRRSSRSARVEAPSTSCPSRRTEPPVTA